MEPIEPITEKVLRAHFGYLFTDYGFSIKDNVCDEGNSGKAVIILASRDLYLRINRGREQLFLEVGLPFDEGVWFDLNDVLAVINRGSGETLGESVTPYDTGKPENQFEEISSLLEKKLGEIIILFQMPRYEGTKRRLRDYAPHKVERLLSEPQNTGLEFVIESAHSSGIDNLIKQLLIPETRRIYRFADNGTIGIWVIVKEADIDLEMRYSGLFFSVLENFPSLRCDFMVYGENELGSAPLPINATVVYDRGES